MTDRKSICLPAPAKLNLMLHITGQRDDGYHELQTVFQFIDLCDELHFSSRDDGVIARERGNDQVEAGSDLIVRSARMLQQQTGSGCGADIRVEKRIPMGAGLGGGSSDAATTLHALNRLWDLGLDTVTLAEIGLNLGADVPVFVHGFAAFAEGVGERLQPVTVDERWALVITPDVHVSTAEIFSDPELTRDSPALKICDLSTSGWDNVCVPVVAKRYPDVDKALKLLGEYSDSRMSGTGASVFALFDSQPAAEQTQQRLLDQADWPANWRSFVCKGKNTSPLVESLEHQAGS